jgi:hypothetical protein
MAGGPEQDRAEGRPSRLWSLLLLPSYVGLLWVPFHADAKPELFGFSFS